MTTVYIDPGKDYTDVTIFKEDEAMIYAFFHSEWLNDSIAKKLVDDFPNAEFIIQHWGIGVGMVDSFERLNIPYKTVKCRKRVKQ